MSVSLAHTVISWSTPPALTLPEADDSATNPQWWGLVAQLVEEYRVYRHWPPQADARWNSLAKQERVTPRTPVQAAYLARIGLPTARIVFIR